MNKAVDQPGVQTGRWSESVFVLFAFLLAKFFMLSITGYFPGEHPLLVATIAASFCATFAAIIACVWIDRRNGGAFLGRMHLSIQQLGACIRAGIATALCAWVLLELFRISGPAAPVFMQEFLDKGPAILLLWIASSLVAAPVGEEIVFRGAIQD